MKFRLKVTICMVWLLTLAYGIGGGTLVRLSFQQALSQERQAAVDSYRMGRNTLALVSESGTQVNIDTLGLTLDQLNQQNAWQAVRLEQEDQEPYSAGSLARKFRRLESDASHCTALIWQDGEQWLLQVSGSLQINKHPARLDILYDISSPYQTRAQQLAILQRIFLIGIAAGGLLCWGIAYLLTRPVVELSAAARRFAGGELSHRVKCRSGDEIGQLAGDFNAMAQQIETNLVQLQETMRRQEQFMGSFAHELKTPMTAIIGYADLLRTQSLQPDEAMEAANYIFSEGKRLESLSLRLLDLLVMKNQSIKLSRVEPAQMIGALVQHLRPVYARDAITLRCKCKPGACLLEPGLISSLLVNLIDNARKALDGGGVIYVVSDWVDGRCRIRVVDNGRGMPEQTLAHLTEAFYRVDKSRSRAQGGAGLGLALCQQIVQLHGGTMEFASRIGNGTCVTVILGGERL